jgi:serine/threonine-protein kinase HipA
MKIFKTDRCLGCYDNIATGFYHPKCSKDLFGVSDPPYLDTTQHELEIKAREFLSRRRSVTGVQPKLSLNLVTESLPRFTVVGSLGGGYIMKPQTSDYPEMPQIEDLSMHMAKSMKIDTARHGLLPTKDGELAYLTKRFDRQRGEPKKIAVEDLCQLSELLTEQKYRSSYEQAGKVIAKYSSIPGDDVLRYFELIVFSFVIGNNDMHLKNFSLITENPQHIVLSPAYDLLSVRLLLSDKEDPEQVALTINGKKNRLEKKDFITLATTLKIPGKVAVYILSKQIKAQETLQSWIAKSFLSKHLKTQFSSIIVKNTNLLA